MDFLDDFVIGLQSDEFIPQEWEDAWADEVCDMSLNDQLCDDFDDMI